METSELTLAELRKEIFDLDELYTEFAKLKRQKTLQDKKYRGALNAVKTARANLSSAEEVIDRYKHSVVTTEDYEAVLAELEEARTKCKSLEDDYHNLVNSSEIRYQKTCQEYVDKIAALELERNLLQDEDTQPQLQWKRQTRNKKGANGKLQVASDDSVREVEVLETKLKELRSELEFMRLKNDPAEVSLKDKYEKEISDLKEQNLKQQHWSAREVEIYKTKLEELRSELECMRSKNDSAEVSLKDKYEEEVYDLEEYTDKTAAVEVEQNMLQDEDNQPQLQWERQTLNKKDASGNLQLAYDDSAREVEILKTKLEELRSELECMRFTNEFAEVSLKDRYDKEICDLKEQNLKQQELSVREVEIYKTKLEELSSELECMRSKNDSAEVSLKDKYETALGLEQNMLQDEDNQPQLQWETQTRNKKDANGKLQLAYDDSVCEVQILKTTLEELRRELECMRLKNDSVEVSLKDKYEKEISDLNEQNLKQWELSVREVETLKAKLKKRRSELKCMRLKNDSAEVSLKDKYEKEISDLKEQHLKQQDLSVREVETLKTKMEGMRLKNYSAEVSLKDKYEKEISDLKEQHLKKQDLSVREVETLKTKLEDMRLKNDSAEVSLKDKYEKEIYDLKEQTKQLKQLTEQSLEKTNLTSEPVDIDDNSICLFEEQIEQFPAEKNRIATATEDSSSDVDEEEYREASCPTNSASVLPVSPLPPSPSFTKEGVENDVEVLSTPKLQRSNKKRVQRGDITKTTLKTLCRVLSSNDKELLEIVSCNDASLQTQLSTSPTQKSQPVENIVIRRKKMSMHTQTDNGIVKKYMIASTQTEIGRKTCKSIQTDNGIVKKYMTASTQTEIGSKTNSLLRVDNTGKITKVKKMKHFQTPNNGVKEQGIQIPDHHLSLSIVADHDSTANKSERKLFIKETDLKQGAVIKLRLCEGSEKISTEGHDTESEVMEPISISLVDLTNEIVEPKSVDSGYVRTDDTDCENDGSFVVDNHKVRTHLETRLEENRVAKKIPGILASKRGSKKRKSESFSKAATTGRYYLRKSPRNANSIDILDSDSEFSTTSDVSNGPRRGHFAVLKDHIVQNRKKLLHGGSSLDLVEGCQNSSNRQNVEVMGLSTSRNTSNSSSSMSNIINSECQNEPRLSDLSVSKSFTSSTPNTTVISHNSRSQTKTHHNQKAQNLILMKDRMEKAKFQHQQTSKVSVSDCNFIVPLHQNLTEQHGSIFDPTAKRETPKIICPSRSVDKSDYFSSQHSELDTSSQINASELGEAHKMKAVKLFGSDSEQDMSSSPKKSIETHKKATERSGSNSEFDTSSQINASELGNKSHKKKARKLLGLGSELDTSSSPNKSKSETHEEATLKPFGSDSDCDTSSQINTEVPQSSPEVKRKQRRARKTTDTNKNNNAMTLGFQGGNCVVTSREKSRRDTSVVGSDSEQDMSSSPKKSIKTHKKATERCGSNSEFDTSSQINASELGNKSHKKKARKLLGSDSELDTSSSPNKSNSKSETHEAATLKPFGSDSDCDTSSQIDTEVPQSSPEVKRKRGRPRKTTDTNKNNNAMTLGFQGGNCVVTSREKSRRDTSVVAKNSMLAKLEGRINQTRKKQNANGEDSVRKTRSSQRKANFQIRSAPCLGCPSHGGVTSPNRSASGRLSNAITALEKTLQVLENPVPNTMIKVACSNDDVLQNNGKRRIAHVAKHGKKPKLSNDDSSELSDSGAVPSSDIVSMSMGSSSLCGRLSDAQVYGRDEKSETAGPGRASMMSPRRSSRINGRQLVDGDVKTVKSGSGSSQTSRYRRTVSLSDVSEMPTMSCRTTSLPDLTGRSLSPRHSRRISEPNAPQKLPVVLKAAMDEKRDLLISPRCSRRISGGPPEGNSAKRNRKIKLQNLQNPSNEAIAQKQRPQQGSTRIADEQPDNKLTIDQVLCRQKAAEKLAASIASKGTEQKSFKRPLCKRSSLHLSPALEVVGVLAPKAIPMGKIPAESRPKVVQLQIIPEVAQMSVAQGKRLLEEMLQFHEAENIRAVARSFMGQKPEFVVMLVLQRAMIDQRAELMKRKSTTEPVLTVPQDALLKLMLALEKLGGEGVCNAFLDVAEHQLPTLTDPVSLWSITRLYVATCKVNLNIVRIRKMLCNSFASMGDLAIPFIYIALQSWFEVMPIKQSPLHESLFVKAVMQLVLLKSCSKPGYNLSNLRQLLKCYYEYPSDMHDSKELLLELFNSYIEDGNECYEALALALSQTVDKKWVFNQIETTIKPKAQETNNVYHLCGIVKLVGSVTKFYSKTLNASVIENNRQWLIHFCDGPFPDCVREGAMRSLTRLSKKCK